MNCPTCNVPLTMTERQGIEIDYCPKCRGVWLDRGELDKIIERATASEMPRVDRASRDYRDYDDDDDWKRGRRRGGWLSELFD